MAIVDAHELPSGGGIEQTNPELYASLLEGCDRFWDDRPARFKGQHEREGAKEAFIARETAFVDSVYAPIAELAAVREGPVTLLLDCDETFVKNVYEEGDPEPSLMLVRPGMDTLVRLLDTTLGDRYDIGLLTSRAQSHLVEEQQTHEYGYMLHLGDHLNREFVISSRRDEDNPIYQHDALQTVPERLSWGENEIAVNAIRSIMRPELIEAALADDHMTIREVVNRAHWYDSKLAIVAHLADEHPNRGFVFVDDLPFPSAIDPNHQQVRGVALGDAMFVVR